MSVEE